ncbi:DUF2247 family protein [Pseudomonas sp. GV071]|jgi:hypothetical protein|uniref:DUF2247 family protein n=1 Tax=Pseudomonas sp. GV071 TaxID=2135754 RepID=UPI000D3A6B15|nr:DUF2247 family protein [Pseudomonas sp. GV071]
MSPFKTLIELGLMSWSTAVLGFRRGWVERNEIFDYAISQLASDDNTENMDVAVIAGGEYLSNEELLGLMLKQAGTSDDISGLDKWRLAFLLNVEMSGGSDEDKVSRLQEIYAGFDYPEDMTSCSIYSKGNESPLVAMHNLVKALRGRF